MRRKIALHNLGCKVNACELDKIAERLAGEGYEIVPFTDTADVYVVNTCTVTQIADRKSRQMLHRAKKQNPDAIVVALGCYVDTDPEGVNGDRAIDIALPNRDKGQLDRVLNAYFAERETAAAGEDPESLSPVFPARSRTRAYVKIQDGCNLRCTYCIIPAARGPSVSRDADEVLEEIRALSADGVREIVLTGIHISSYGLDRTREGGIRLAELVMRADKIDGIERIRLGSLEPRMVTQEFVAGLSQTKKLCPHFHLSLQSGSDAVLKRMHRRYTTQDYRESVRLLRSVFDTPALTTDIITGFPKESEEEFEETVRFVNEIGFYEMHVFPFSARKNTPAYTMEGQLTWKQKTERSRRLIAIGREMSARYREQFLSREANVLWEEEIELDGRKLLTGYTERYVRVAGQGTARERGTIARIRPAHCLENDILFAERI